MAYALSPDLQSRYTGPMDLFLRGGSQFLTSTLWYAVSFPRWGGYRVVHDPAYTAYLAPAEVVAPAMNLGAIVGLMILVLIVMAVIVAIVAIVTRKKGKGHPPQ